jgi:hypothetical protein
VECLIVIHGLILREVYAAAPALWRPMAEMKLMYIVGASPRSVSPASRLADSAQSLHAALRYGLLCGVGAGVSMGYGSFAVMPIPYVMAFTWFAGTVVEALVAALLAALIIREP